MSSGENHIEVVGTETPSGVRWLPAEGEETAQLLDRRLPGQDAARREVLASAQDILSHCVPPTAGEGQHTELAVGYVQSGKTLSFTTVAALANDNSFRVVIVIAGTTNDLADQTRDRLLRDLGIEESPFTRWQHFHEPSPSDADRVRDVLDEWNDASVPREERRTVLITVKKHHGRLQQLVRLLQQLGPLRGVPTLIIDDEADQASLNNLVQDGDLSTTYDRILQLKNALPLHSFIQYTATPQANLLINLIDILSPERCVVLQPGADYVGGATFFASNSPYLELIPAEEIPERDDQFGEPPNSLIRAMKLFFIGVSSGLHRRDGRPSNRSMMVHPARTTDEHRQYYNWIQSIRSSWMEVLDGAAGDEDRQNLLDEFEIVHRELQSTVADLEPFDVIAQRLLRDIRGTSVVEVNYRSDVEQVRWNSSYAWILVGGQKLDRGFTVEGLTVTYMPRGPGVGNADTIQQRARFLGYRRAYLGFCRVFLDVDVTNAYRAYVEHEEDIRSRLIRHIQSGRSLNEFRRVFICDRSLRPTRQSVLDIDYERPSFRTGWYAPSRPLLAVDRVERNRDTVTRFIGRPEIELVPDNGLTAAQRHHIARGVSLQTVYDHLLSVVEVGDMEEDRKWIVALILLDRWLGHRPDSTCTLFHMSGGNERRRGTENGQILNLFQGANPSTGPRQGSVYAGDRQMTGDDEVTVQIHNVTFVDGHVSRGSDLLDNVPIIAIWMAREVRRDVLVQGQVL